MRTMLSRSLLGVAAMVLLTCASLLWAEPLNPRIKVDFQHPVIVASQTLSPGDYVFQQLRTPGPPPVFRVTDSRGNNITLTGVAIRTRVPQSASTVLPPAANDTEVVLQKINGKYYLDKIWIQGRSRGWDFGIPDSVKSQASNMQQEVVNGTYEEDNQNNASASNEQNSQSSAQSNSEAGQNANGNAAMNNNEASTSASTSTSSAPQNTESANQSNTDQMTATSANSGQQSQNGTTWSATTGEPVQTSSSAMTSGEQAQTSTMNSGEQVNSVTGCLQRGSSPDAYYVQTASGSQVNVKPTSTIENEIGKQVGHTVRLVGQQLGSGGQLSSASTGTNNSTGSYAGMFQVDRVDVISMSCGQ